MTLRFQVLWLQWLVNDSCSWLFWRHLQDAGRQATGDSNPGMPWGSNSKKPILMEIHTLSVHSLTGQPVAKGIEPFCSPGPESLIASLCLVWLSSEAPKVAFRRGWTKECGDTQIWRLSWEGFWTSVCCEALDLYQTRLQLLHLRWDVYLSASP